MSISTVHRLGVHRRPLGRASSKQWQLPTLPQVFACVTHVLCIFVASVLMFSGGTIAGGVIFLLLACLLAYFYYATRDRLELCARLFGVSSTGLTEHPEIIGMAVRHDA